MVSTCRKEAGFMNKLFEYTSVFAPYIENYIHEKELTGYKATQLKWILLEFDKFFTQISKKDLFISSVDIKTGHRPGPAINRIPYIRSIAQWLSSVD
jgi:hypothetical protein